MKNVLFIAYYFPPIGGGGIHRSINFVKYLPGFGYFPIVLTCSIPAEDRWAPRDDTLEKNLNINSIVLRISTPPPLPDTKIMRRLKKIFFLQDNFSKWWIRYAIKLGEEIIKENKIDVIYATMSPFQSSYVANYLSKKYNIPWVADLRDPWALDEMVLYPSLLHRRYDLFRMKVVLLGASAVIMNTQEAVESLKKHFFEFKNKHVLSITNGYDANDFNFNTDRKNINKFCIVHSGTLFSETGMQLKRRKTIYNVLGGANKNVNILGRSLVYLLKSLEEWIEECPEITNRLEVLLIGKLTPDDVAILEGRKCKNIFVCTGYVSHEESVGYLKSANVLFLPMHGTTGGLRATTVPGKLYEYMASGRPILAAVPEGDAKDILMKSGLSYISPPDDNKLLLKGLKSIYNDWENNINRYNPNWDYISMYERKNLTKKLAEVFNTVII
jgi:glycosyltransferase involved in cell wall biosynthesis